MYIIIYLYLCSKLENIFFYAPKKIIKQKALLWTIFRAGNLLNGFLNKSLIFCEKWANERFAQKNAWFAHFWWATWAICSWLLNFGEQPERITQGCSFLVSDPSDSLIFGERPQRFAHQKRGNEQIANFLNKPYLYKTY